VNYRVFVWYYNYFLRLAIITETNWWRWSEFWVIYLHSYTSIEYYWRLCGVADSYIVNDYNFYDDIAYYYGLFRKTKINDTCVFTSSLQLHGGRWTRINTILKMTFALFRKLRKRCTMVIRTNLTPLTAACEDTVGTQLQL